MPIPNDAGLRCKRTKLFHWLAGRRSAPDYSLDGSWRFTGGIFASSSLHYRPRGHSGLPGVHPTPLPLSRHYEPAGCSIDIRLLRRVNYVAENDSFLYRHYKRALRQVLPLFSSGTCFGCRYQQRWSGFAYNIYVVTLDDPASVSLPASGVIAFIPCWNSVLPLLLICELPRWAAKRVTADENTALRKYS